jgi:hypothetical protein
LVEADTLSVVHRRADIPRQGDFHRVWITAQRL